jgi:catechol 2,3-dioxygenase-like lactoylglutathione lyase family enzyme
LACCAHNSPSAQLAHFHHVHLSATDPAAAIAFYTSKFDCEKASFAGMQDAVWTRAKTI